jgi:predicted ATPase
MPLIVWSGGRHRQDSPGLAGCGQQQAAFTHGVFVSLAHLTGREQIITAIADALGFVLYGATDRATQLVHYLHEKALLLVLDNFERWPMTPALLWSVICYGAPALKLLATSREPLHLQAEWVFEVQGLPLPESEKSDELESSSSVKLFLQRARQARVGFTLTAEDRPAVARICQWVEGLPLGIELAAAWVLTLSCQEIARELERSLADPLRGMDFLATATRDMPERHRSITAVFDHSWKLLSAEEQRVLRQLSVFRAVWAKRPMRDRCLAIPVIALVSKSLLRRTMPRQAATIGTNGCDCPCWPVCKWISRKYIDTQDRHCHYYTALLERGDRL